jgi:hypothetical protein
MIEMLVLTLPDYFKFIQQEKNLKKFSMGIFLVTKKAIPHFFNHSLNLKWHKVNSLLREDGAAIKSP